MQKLELHEFEFWEKSECHNSQTGLEDEGWGGGIWWKADQL